MPNITPAHTTAIILLYLLNDDKINPRTSNSSHIAGMTAINKTANIGLGINVPSVVIPSIVCTMLGNNITISIDIHTVKIYIPAYKNTAAKKCFIGGNLNGNAALKSTLKINAKPIETTTNMS